MKKIYIYTYQQKVHSLYKEIINTPPSGYEYIVEDSKINDSMKSFYTNTTIKNSAFKIGGIIDIVRIKDSIYKRKTLPAHDLIYSTGYLCLRNEPWIVDMEFPTSLTGYDMKRFERRKKKIAKILSSEHCKRIIPWTDAASDCMRACFPQEKICKKILTVPLAVRKKNAQKKHIRDGKVRLFFLGSSNLLDDFIIKGGPETLEAFKRLVERNKGEYDHVELIMRCNVPIKFKNRYSNFNITIIDKIIPWKKLEELYTTSDIFIGIAHHTPGVAHLEAMSYGLPVIATDVWENKKIVSKDAGILIPKNKNAQYNEKYGMPLWGMPRFMKEIEIEDNERIDALTAAMKTLIDNEKLRIQMGLSARKLTEEGPYSIEERNKLLKKVYDEATNDDEKCTKSA